MIPFFQYTTVHVGIIPIQVWGFFVALGMLTSFGILFLQTKKNPRKNEIFDIAFLVILWGFVGARMGHVIFYEPQFFLSHPLDILKIWQGGMSSLGAFIAAGGSFFYLMKKNNLRFKELADSFLVAALPGWIIGRVGCFMIHDHWGVHSNCPLAIMTPTGSRLDMAMLEILGLIPLGVWLLCVRGKSFKPGTQALIIVAYYSILRFFLDFFRATDIPNADTRWFGLTPAQYFSIILVLFIAKRWGRIAV